MELVDVKNNLLINKIVKKHFSLKSKSQRLFTERLLYERPIAKEFQKILDSQNSKDLRARFSLEVDAMEGFDSSWQTFKSHFFDYVRERGLQYKNFLSNKVLINKNEIKIVKDLISYFEEKADLYFNGIGFGNGRFSVYGYAQNIFDSEGAAFEILKQEIKSKLKVEASELEHLPFYLDIPYFLTFEGFYSTIVFEKRNRPFSYDSYMDNFNARDLNDFSNQMDLFFKEENYDETNIVFYNKEISKFIHLSISSLFSKQEINKIKEQIKNTIKEENEKYIRRVFANITQEKFFKGQELELVFSLNYADWFLASTGDSWSSCISLYSNYDECFWTGIPQLIGDKSRAMIYITEKNGKKKEFHGIKVDKFIARSWIQLWRSKSNNETFFSLTKSYPIEIKVKDNLENILGLREIGYSYNNSYIVSRYYSENLWFENNFLTTIYLDLGSYKIAKRNKAKYSPGEYGYYSLSDGRGSCRFRKTLGSIEKISDFLYKGTIFDDIISNSSSVIEEYYYQDEYEEEYDEYEEEEAW